MVSKAIENAQKKVEGHNFDIRKQLLEYDDVMNKQREVIYDQRKMILEGGELHETVEAMALEVLDQEMDLHTPEAKTPEEWELAELRDALTRHFPMDIKVDDGNNIAIAGDRFEFDTVTFEQMQTKLEDEVKSELEQKQKLFGEEYWREIEKHITLNIVDSNWKDHLLSMDFLKEGIGLRGYAQKNPLNEYKREGSQMFTAMIDTIREDTVGALFRVQADMDEDTRSQRREMSREMKKTRTVEHHGDGDAKVETVRRKGKKVGRNDPCPCGSGKKYKKCHGRG